MSSSMDSPLDYDSTATYIELVRLLKPYLATFEPSYRSRPPEFLSIEAHDFLKLSIGVTDESMDSRGKLPPTRVCIDPNCAKALLADPSLLRNRELVEPNTIPVTIFTKEFGSIPGFATSRYCRNCHTWYFPNYFVQATERTYYAGVSMLIQSSQHFYIDKELCELFSVMMVTSWTSATNCARTYNSGLSNEAIQPSLPATWSTSLELDVQDVWNAFFLYALLLDNQVHGTILHLSHTAPSQFERLRPALHERNLRMAGVGQPGWNHACNLCCSIYIDEDGNEYVVRSTVTDGITIGSPCCAVHDCLEPLVSVKHRYCTLHRALDKQCAVTTCERDSETGFRTCPDPEHRRLESYDYLQGKAMFQLKHRLERLKVSQTHDSLAPGSSTSPNRMADEGDGDLMPELVDAPQGDDEDDEGAAEGPGADADEDVEIDVAGICEGKPETGNKTVRARFGRRRTHNEQLCVGSCGVILGRATFYGSEAPNGVHEFWMKLFPTKASLPQVLWHDNNCRMVAMLKNDPEEYLRNYFDRCALPVDVFHFKCKHKEGDLDDGKWRFNSSAAEQTNAWFGGFHSMVREMQTDRYNFFLDEMILRRNKTLTKDLARRGEMPYSIPRSELLKPDTLSSSSESPSD
ncbi:hypothetical protein B0H16DRAFT_1889524 [Mycena metata]|uniref:CxC5 like cysteine cluster associated with KDZ domain-containing protein n=1 Tax=Mycena metata TaxID=1033252 RepID=A0AAD7IMJ5_9AGAR|nr:hypothetical protein B0H16DRAFT_1889524 [Mycena metata]